MKSNVFRTVVALSVLVMAVFGGYIGQQIYAQKKITLVHGTLLTTPRQVAPFSLTGIDNKPYNNERLQHRWTIMFFGFTHCGYMCPTTMAELGQMYRLLEQKEARVLPEVVMISLDPERDDIVRLGQYVRAFDKHFYGARGEASMIHHMTQDLGIAYMKVKPTSNQSPQDNIEHTGAIMVFNPQGNLVAFFTNPHHASDLVDDFLLLTKGKQYS